MKIAKKRSLIIIGLALIAGLVWLVWLRSRTDVSDRPIGELAADASRGPSFEVRVVVPRMGRPFGGILPDWVVKKMDATPGELRFDHTSVGAKIGSVGNDRVELLADGWDLLIEADGEGRIASGTRIVFPLALGGRHLRLSCRPNSRDAGYLNTTTRPSSNELVGRFVVEVSACKNAESGKTSNWPPAPLTVSGSFVSPPQRPSPDPKVDSSPTN